MGISSLGVGSNVLTQDVIDQLKAADKSQYVKPITTKISAEKSKAGQLNIINALMHNLTESTGNVSQYGLFDTRSATATGSAVSVTANSGSEIQNFSIDVNTIATKEIEQSGSFSSATSTIASGDGSMKLSVGSKDFNFDYNASTTLTQLKDQINKDAGDTVQASIVQVGSDDFRLFLTATNTGTDHDISIKDNDSDLDNQLLEKTDDNSDGYTNVQSATDATFKYDGVDVTRKNNSISDLLSGVTIQIKEPGTSDVSIKQDVKGIEDKLDSFVKKFNSAVNQITTMTKSSKDVKERGTFSDDMTIKNMKRTIMNMVGSAGDSVGGRLGDYGFSSNKDGTISLDHSKFEGKLKENPDNVKAFFSGGTFTKADGSTKSIDGAFDQMENTLNRYTSYSGSLNQLKTSYATRLSSLEKEQQQATDRLTAKYNIMAKRFAAYDLMISKINSASSIFTQLANAQAAAAK